MNYNLKKSRNELMRDDNSYIPSSNDEANQINSDLVSIDTQKMFEKMNELLNNIQYEIGKKFETSKYYTKIKDIFETKFELIREYFLRCMNHTEDVKMSVLENLSKLQPKQKQNFDENLVQLINNLSSIIRDLMKNSKSTLKQAHSNAEAANDQMFNIKSNLSEINNQIVNTILQASNKYSQKQTKEKVLKDKLSASIDQIESLNMIKDNINKNLKYLENYSAKFYDDAKVIFKKMKDLHNEKLYELTDTKFSFNRTDEDAFNKKIRGRSQDPLRKRDRSMEIKRSLFDNSGILDSSMGFSKYKAADKTEYVSKINELNKRNQELLEEIATLHENYVTLKYENMNLKQGVDRIEGEEHTHNIGCLNNIKVSEMVISFVKKLNSLQEAISNKTKDVKEQKLNFEKAKREVYKFAQETLKQSTDDQLTEFASLIEEADLLRLERENLMNEVNSMAEIINENAELIKKLETDNKLIHKELNCLKNSQEMNKVDNKSKEDLAKLKTLNNNLENLVKNLGEDIEKKNQLIQHMTKKVNESESYKLKYEEISKVLEKTKEENKKKINSFENTITNIDKHIKSIENFNIDIYEEFGINKNEEIDKKIGKIANGFFEILSKMNEDKNEKDIKHLDSELESLRNENYNLAQKYEKIKNEDLSKINSLEIELKNMNDQYYNLVQIRNDNNLEIEDKLHEMNDLKQKNDMLCEYIENYEKEVNELKAKINKYEIKIKELEDSNRTETSVKDKMKEYESIIFKHKTAINEKDILINNLETEQLKLNSTFKQKEEEISTLRTNLFEKAAEQEGLINGYKKVIDEKTKSCNTLENDLQRYKKIMFESEMKVKQLEADFIRTKMLLEEYQVKVNFLEKNIVDKENELNEKCLSIKNLQDAINSVKSESKSKDEQIIELENIINRYKGIIEDSPEEHEKKNKEILDKLKNSLDEINKQQVKLNEQEKQFATNLEKISELENKNKRLQDDSKNKSDTINKLELNTLTLEKEITNNNQALQELQIVNKSLEKDLSIKNIKAIQDLEENKNNLENEIESLKSKLEILAKESNQKIEELQKQLQETKTELDIDDDLINADEYINQINQFKREIESSKNRIEELETQVKSVLLLLHNANEDKATYQDKCMELEKELKIKDQDLTIKENEIERLEINLLSVEEKLKFYENAKDENIDFISNLKKDLAEKENIIKTTLDKLNEAELNLFNLKIKYSEIENLNKDSAKEYDVKTTILKPSEDKLKALNLQLTNKINLITAENTNLKDDIERIENNFSIVVTHINTFFENIIKAIFMLKSETGITFLEEIENRMKVYEENSEEQYNLENLEKDLEYAFILITDVFTQYQHTLAKLNEMGDKTKSNNKIMIYRDEIKRLRLMFDECTQSIYEAIKSTGFIDEDMAISFMGNQDSFDSSLNFNNNSDREFISKAVEMFKAYNNEINELNKTLEKQLMEEQANVKKYKIIADEYRAALDKGKDIKKVEILQEEKNRHFTVEDLLNGSMIEEEEEEEFVLDYSFIKKKPEKYLVIYECTYNDYNWLLLAEKDVSPNSYCFKNLIWVPDDELPEIEKVDNYTNNKKDKEIIDLLSIQDELCQKIEMKEEEIVGYKETINKLLQNNINPGSKTISFEKYQMALRTLQEEQEKNDELARVYDELKMSFDQYRQNIEKKVENLDVGNLLENHNRKSIAINEGDVVKTQHSMNSFNNPNNTPSQQHIEKTVNALEENENLLINQLRDIKEELKATRKQRDELRVKFNETITLQDGKNREIIEMLKHAIEKLILEINVNSKIKELLTVIMRGLNYSEDQISNILSNTKKKTILGIFK